VEQAVQVTAPFRKEARLHESVVQKIAREALPREQLTHTTKEKKMAQRVSITLVDDLDGSEATETVSFALDGTQYEIDLSSANAETMRKNFDMYVGVARKVSGRKRRRTTTGGGSETKAIREWAREQGMEVSSRGILPAEVREAYAAAH
jgi:hypothetical protein